jgi:hypothetical protein
MSTFNSNDEVEPKQVVPVVAGNTRIILSVPEWAISLMLFVFYFITTGKLWWICLIAQIIFTMVYVLFLSKLEENIMSVLIHAAKLPDIIYGSFNKPMPLDKREENDFFNSAE